MIERRARHVDISHRKLLLGERCCRCRVLLSRLLVSEGTRVAHIVEYNLSVTHGHLCHMDDRLFRRRSVCVDEACAMDMDCWIGREFSQLVCSVLRVF